MTRRYCRKTKWPFTTSYHTRFPEYVSARLPVPESWCYALQRRFHNGAAGTFVATQSIEDELHARGFERLMRWSRGVDTELFRPRKVRRFGKKPVFLYVGRIAVEKNIKAFLDVDLPGRKVLVGSGPQAAELRGVIRMCCSPGQWRARSWRVPMPPPTSSCFRASPTRSAWCCSRRLASGVPVAAFPVPGPKDVLTDPESGAMDWDLKAAMAKALTLDRHAARAHALRYSWENSARQFIDNVLIAHHRKLPERRRRWRRNRQKKAARLGGNRAASLSRVSLGDAWGISRPPKDG